MRPLVGGRGAGRQVRRDDDGFAVECAAGVEGEGGGAGVAVVGVFGHGAGDDRIQACRDARAKSARRRWRGVEVGVDDGGHTLHRKGSPAGQGLKEDAAQRVDVDAPVAGVAVEPFGCDVVERADHGAGGGERPGSAAVDRAGDAEVGHIDEVAAGATGFGAGDEDVGGFDIAVNQSGGVSGIQGGGDLRDDVDDPARRQWATV